MNLLDMNYEFKLSYSIQYAYAKVVLPVYRKFCNSFPVNMDRYSKSDRSRLLLIPAGI